ncbi:MAG: alanine racemase [Paludibacteraceae bacterium]|nr:alanine racemase [Paludibacteraceae bacterium]MBR4460184.1 alanine racemase [Paludibacteraceae bacterium]
MMIPVEEIGHIKHLLTDSRQLGAEPEATLFFALRTAKNDGANYISELYEKGVRTFVVHEDGTNWADTYPEAKFFCVPDTLAALQELAAWKRAQYPNAQVIGITGSNGKTVVKEWLYELLKEDYKITRSPKSYNSQIGVPLSVWQMNEETELAIFEAGISQPGEMERLEKIIRPTIGVITYIGHEHDENFRSLEEKRAEKMKLFARCPVVIEDKMHQNARTCALVMRQLGYDEEVIQERLLRKTHETVMQVNLSALADNVRYFKGLLKPETKLTCMVKAFAYGTGSVEIAQCLQEHGADYLAVAVCDEGVELRRAGISLPIIIMDPETPALERIIENNLEPNIYSFQSLENFLAAAEKAGVEHHPIHIKIDSGMHRLGFEWADMEALAARLKNQKAVRVKSVFSHLCVADEPQWDAFTKEQIDLFSRCADYLRSQLDYPVMKHILNSAGIERFTEYQFDMCRLGIGLYGFSFAGAKLRNVCTLKSTLLSVKTVKAGESIGYGRHTWLHEDRQIGVIPIGYADGFDRKFGNGGGEVLVRGKRCPVMGNVCMDLCMIDVTGTDAQPGDEATIFGDNLPIEELANKLDTITYEILTGVSRRVKRVYFYE